MIKNTKNPVFVKVFCYICLHISEVFSQTDVSGQLSVEQENIVAREKQILKKCLKN